MILKEEAPVRDCTKVGPGDFIKVFNKWYKIKSNTAFGQETTPKSWTVVTDDGLTMGMFNIERYAKKEDFK